jgi:hypothetical protein
VAETISKSYREEVCMFQPCLMLRPLTPQNITAAQQREADEQLGEIVAAVVRGTHPIAARAHAVAAMLTRPKRAARAGAVCD